MDLSSGLPKIPVCKISLSYDDRYYIDFMGGNANQSHIFLWFSRESPQGGLGTFSESPQSVLRGKGLESRDDVGVSELSKLFSLRTL